MNTFYSSHYGSYSKGNPHYLHDRPREVVLQLFERRRLVLTSDLTGITHQMEAHFTVLSFTNKLCECHKVNLGNEVERSRCIVAMTEGKTG